MTQRNEGDIINGRYKLVGYVGKGTFGEVWRAHDTVLDIEVAVKFYIPLDNKGRKEFMGEYKTSYGLHHPNLLVPTYYDIWGTTPYLVMEYCPRGASSKLVGDMDEESLWRFVRGVAAGLDYLHSLQPNPIVHQDIKPENVLVNNQGDYVISDFGISMNMRSTMQKQSGRANETAGAVAYMGPERFSENPVPIKASDIWSLGVSIYEMATGELPFCGLGGGMQKNGAEMPVLPEKYSRKLNYVMQKCLQEQPWDRFTAADVVEYCDHRDEKPEPEEPPAPPKPKFRWWHVVAPVVVVAGGIAFLTLLWKKTPSAEEMYPVYLEYVDSCRAQTERGGPESVAIILIRAKENLAKVQEMDSLYGAEDTNYCQGKELEKKLTPKLEQVSVIWAESAKELYKSEDEEDRAWALEYFDTSLRLYENPIVRADYEKAKTKKQND